jgi:hypothetical protein
MLTCGICDIVMAIILPVSRNFDGQYFKLPHQVLYAHYEPDACRSLQSGCPYRGIALLTTHGRIITDSKPARKRWHIDKTVLLTALPFDVKRVIV